MKEIIANKEYTLCDRCGAKIEYHGWMMFTIASHQTVEQIMNGEPYTCMDLCHECLDALNNWFDEFTSNEADVEEIAPE